LLCCQYGWASSPAPSGMLFISSTPCSASAIHHLLLPLCSTTRVCKNASYKWTHVFKRRSGLFFVYHICFVEMHIILLLDMCIWPKFPIS
jgi:hypothetical protein